MSTPSYVLCVDSNPDISDDLIDTITGNKCTEDYEIEHYNAKSITIKSNLPVKLFDYDVTTSNKYYLRKIDVGDFTCIIKDNDGVYRRCIRSEYDIVFVDRTKYVNETSNGIEILSNNKFKISFNPVNIDSITRHKTTLKHLARDNKRYDFSKYDFNNVKVSISQNNCNIFRDIEVIGLMINVYYIGEPVADTKFTKMTKDEYEQYIKNNTCDILKDNEFNVIAVYPSSNRIINVHGTGRSDDIETNYLRYTVTCKNCVNCVACVDCFMCVDCYRCEKCEYCDNCYKAIDCTDCKNCINVYVRSIESNLFKQ